MNPVDRRVVRAGSNVNFEGRSTIAKPQAGVPRFYMQGKGIINHVFRAEEDWRYLRPQASHSVEV